jgi:phosphoglycolate phosphatase-like HAD superfamily hydrolase
MALVLFDIDGTLLRGGNSTHARAFEVACQQVFGVSGDLSETDLAGRTDRYILQAVLERSNIQASEAEVLASFELMEAYVEQALTESLVDRVLPGVPDLLTALGAAGHQLGLVTGNLPRIARVKLQQAGLWAAFDGIGGYGHLSPDRSDLVRAVLERTGAPPHQTVVIGDTVHDVACGKAHGVRTVAVATGRTPLEDLRAVGADLVLETLEAREEIVHFVGMV